MCTFNDPTAGWLVSLGGPSDYRAGHTDHPTSRAPHLLEASNMSEVNAILVDAINTLESGTCRSGGPYTRQTSHDAVFSAPGRALPQSGSRRRSVNADHFLLDRVLAPGWPPTHELNWTIHTIYDWLHQSNYSTSGHKSALKESSSLAYVLGIERKRDSINFIAVTWHAEEWSGYTRTWRPASNTTAVWVWRHEHLDVNDVNHFSDS